MSTKAELEKNIRRMDAELADMRANLANMKEEEKTIFIQKGDIVKGKNQYGRTAIYMVSKATPSRATLRGLNNYSKDVVDVKLEKNYTIKCNQRDVSGYKVELEKVVTFAEVQGDIN